MTTMLQAPYVDTLAYITDLQGEGLTTARKEAMFCQASVDQWQTMIMPHLPHVSKPQLTTYHRPHRHLLTRLT